MRWSNVGIIFRRELRDQLRDRRTIFMIFVFPLMLYPLVGLSVAQLATAYQFRARKVIVVGADALPERQQASEVSVSETPLDQTKETERETVVPLLSSDGKSFNPDLFVSTGEHDLLEVECVPYQPPWTRSDERRNLLHDGSADVVVLIPQDLASSMTAMDRIEIPVAFNGANENSRLSEMRVAGVLNRWKGRMVEARRQLEGKPEGYTEPISSVAQDVATRTETGNSTWARVFPFLLVIMSLTGAFYPAVDICAGEKERGTMETVLISPASRTEIVMGKFFTVMAASMATAILNLVSMGMTGLGLAFQTGALGGAARSANSVLAAPSLESVFWIILILAPLSAFFSALCLSLAVLARSMKEGQYYMTPLYMAALPLVMYSTLPGVELSLFTSLLPITGVSLLLKALIQGEYDLARRYFLPVFLPVVLCGLIALRWAIDQFKSESVLFRESERLDLKAWIQHIFTHKPRRPSATQALLCFVLILVAAWFISLSAGFSLTAMFAMHLGAILSVPMAMTFLLTSDPIGTLRLRLPRFRYLLLGLVLPLALFPLVSELRIWVEWLFPTPDAVRQTTAALEQVLPNLLVAWLVLAVIPAISEEFAFRGFIFSGLENSYKSSWAIVLSALMFGFMHVLLSLFAQLFNATLLGLILALLALRSRSIFPGILFHLTNNSLALFIGNLAKNSDFSQVSTALFRDPENVVFRPIWIIGGTLLSTLLVSLLATRDAHSTREDAIEDTLSKQACTDSQLMVEDSGGSR